MRSIVTAVTPAITPTPASREDASATYESEKCDNNQCINDMFPCDSVECIHGCPPFQCRLKY